MEYELDYQKIGLNIKKNRKRNKLTQQQLADLIYKTESSIRNYEKGIVEIPNGVLIQICNTLNLPIWELLGLDEDTAIAELKGYLMLGDMDVLTKNERNFGELLRNGFNRDAMQGIASSIHVKPWWNNADNKEWHFDEEIRVLDHIKNLEYILIETFNNLNTSGKEEALKRVSELSQLKQYQSGSDKN